VKAVQFVVNAIHGGHAMRVHADSFFQPLSEHIQVLHPSVAMKERFGQQRPSSAVGVGVGSVGAAGQLIVVQFASSLWPLEGQVQLLRPSPLGKML